MSSPLPKSESTTSLLRSSGPHRRSGQHDHRRNRTQHQHPSGAGGGGEAGWTEESETSARRPLCQPRHADSRNMSDNRAQRSHSHRQPSHLDDDYAQEDVRHRTSRHQKERTKSSRSKHPHHHHHHPDSSRVEQPQQGGSRQQDRRTSPTPSYQKQEDEAALFFEPRERVITGSSSSLSSDPPATSAPVQPSSRRKGKRVNATLSEHDASLHPIVKSVFGQDQKKNYKAVQSCEEGGSGGAYLEPLVAMAQNGGNMHSVLGPACIFLRKGFAESRQAVRPRVEARGNG
ncbi:LOW QUALITY PROTEIN: calcium-binding protein 1b [Xyrichtys novacula]|uniref:LOW QUALITY PROTEIN: calcium-binding protein 1b n=1 Tax=Xyrichtys novacula TaxID=13765 RepID=A0AAV1G912_XYRNO|nr:LOW QUALITY PROTEIN: calcium-binding protein 1b [Xyrichtys novacula]